MKTGWYKCMEQDVSEFLVNIENPYFEELSDIDELFLDDTEDINYANADVFLNGSCQLFAAALNEAFGYKVIEIRGLNSNYHYYCSFMINDIEVYIDVRGATTNFDDFISNTMLANDSTYEFIEHNREELDAESKKDGAKFGYRFAKFLVNEYEQFYDKDITLSGE